MLSKSPTPILRNNVHKVLDSFKLTRFLLRRLIDVELDPGVRKVSWSAPQTFKKQKQNKNI